MSTVCPKCGSTYTGQHRCGTTVHSVILSQWDDTVAVHVPPTVRWHQTALGRVFAGLLFGLGISYALLQLCAALIEVWARETGAENLNPAVGWGLFLGLQGIGVIAGGALGTLGVRQGKTYGSLIALLCSAIALLAIQSDAFGRLAAPYLGSLSGDAAGQTLSLQQHPFGKKLCYVLPAFYFLCGAAGGAVGSRLWSSPKQLMMPRFEAEGAEPFQELLTSSGYHPSQAPPAPSPWTGPVAWGRVLLGLAAACGISLVHKNIIQAIVIFAQGNIQIGDSAQEALAAREIFALAILLGGCLAGATRANGLKQGLLVGIGAGAAQSFLAVRLHYPSDQLFFIMMSALFLAPVGGWFGSGLMPPAGPPREVLSEPV